MFRLILLLAGSLIAIPLLALSEPPAEAFNPFSKPDLLKLKPVRKAPVNKPRQVTAEDEAPAFRLSATLISVNAPMAVVNDILLQVGEEIDGMRLLLVDEGRVVLRYKGKKYQLSIDENETEKNATAEPQDTM